jgi:glutaminyl-tRNA synthetase
MEFLNPNSLNVIEEAYLEPFLLNAEVGDKFQFQRLGYFTVDNNSTTKHLIFNKTVGLRDSWAKTSAKKENPSQNNNQNQGQRLPLNEINKIGKKLANLSDDKYEAARSKILKLAEELSYEELAPLFNTAAKKRGTRIAVLISLGVLLKKGQKRNDAINELLENALADENELLVKEASIVDQL